MSEIKINSSRTNTTTHRASVGTEEVKRLLGEEVCRRLGIDPSGAHIGVDVRLSSRMGNYGSEYESLVTITEHHDAQPQAKEE